MGRLLLIGLFCFFFALPATAQFVIQGRASDNRVVSGGDSYQGRIVVVSTAEEAVEAVVTLRGIPVDDAARNRQLRSNAAWVSFTPARLTLLPGEAGVVDYEVAVPDSSVYPGLEGVYWSDLVLSQVPPDAEKARKQPLPSSHPDEVELRSQSFRLATHLPNTSQARLAFLDVELQQHDQNYILQAHLENTGNAMVEPVFYVEMYDLAGNLLDRFDALPEPLYPGLSLRQPVELDGLPPGTYEALIVVDAGAEAQFGAQYTITLGDR